MNNVLSRAGDNLDGQLYVMPQRFWPSCALIAALLAIFLPRVNASTVRGSRPPRNDESHLLRIFLIDVEGGASTLMVTPAGQAVLVDSGWPDPRDADRIFNTIQSAGLHRIDYAITTHFHQDHFGSLAALSQKLPIGEYVDHGLPAAPIDPGTPRDLFNDYVRITQGHRHTAKPGEPISLREFPGQPSLTLTVLASNGATAHFPPAQPNPVCAKATQMPRDTSDNANSVALLLEFGNFRYFDGGDLTWNVEGQLVCPKDEVGTVSVYQVNHHGLAISSNPVLLETLHPQVAVENNGPHKGGEAETFRRLQKLLPNRDIYQLHRNLDTRAEDNTEPDNIANPDATDGGNGIRVDVDTDGNSYRVINERTGHARPYQVAARD